jgi:dTDP-4-dehydrorhamnose reductase
MPIRLAVIGKTGQVARALAEAALSDPRVEVVCFGRPELDLTDAETLRSCLRSAGPGLIVNAGAYTAVDQAETEPERAEAVNGVGAGALAQAAAELGVPLIHLSTDYVFDGVKAGAYTEEDQPSPRSVYGASKLAGELAVAELCPDHVILRTAWVYAPYGKNFVRTMCSLALTKDEVRVVNDQFGCPTYAPEIARAIFEVAAEILQNPSKPHWRGLFHLAGTGETSWAGFAETIFSFLAAKGLRRPAIVPIPSCEYPTRATRPANSRLDCRKLERVYGIRLADWQDSLVACLNLLTEKTGL